MNNLKLDTMINNDMKNRIFGLNEEMIKRERDMRLLRPKHSKKDYEKIGEMNAKEIMYSAIA